MAEESRNEIVSEILNVMDMLYRRAFLTKSQGDRYRNARGTLAMELAVMEEENERLKAALTAPTAPTAAPAPSPEAAVGECQHEAWEENGGWCKCVDCDMGWHMRDGHPTPRDVARPTPEAQESTPPASGGVDVEKYNTLWLHECRRVLEDVATEMRATGRGDTRFVRLIETMPRLSTPSPALARELPEVRRVTADDIDAMLAAYQAVAPAPRDMKVRRMEAAAFALRDRLAIWRASDGR